MTPWFLTKALREPNHKQETFDKLLGKLTDLDKPKALIYFKKI